MSLDKYDFDKTLGRIEYIEQVLLLGCITKDVKENALIELEEVKTYLFSIL